MTMQVIQHIELGSAQSSIVFNSIPQDGTDLLLTISSRSTEATTNSDNVFLQVNSITSGYSNRSLVGTGPAVRSSTNSNNITSKVFVAVSSNQSVSGGGWGSANVYIPNYAGSNNKSFSSDASFEGNNNLENQVGNVIIAGLLSNTAAISSITLTHASNSNFGIGTSATLYKITKGSDGTTTVS